MAELWYGKKRILSDMRVARSTFAISKGLMFAFKKKISRGICLVMPVSKDVKYGAAVTMMFCFYKMDILFVNSSFKVVDKVELKPWKISYIPREKCKYVIESLPKTFNEIEIGEKVTIKGL